MSTQLPTNKIAIAAPSAGHINLYVTVEETVITNVSIANKRPQHIGRLLCNLSSSDALNRIPTLFMLCSQAQQSAALGALLHATGNAFSSTQIERMSVGCALEWLKEHCWQLWQMERELFGADFATEESIALSRLLLQQLRTLTPLAMSDCQPVPQPDWHAIQLALEPLFGVPVQTFIDFSMKQLDQWAQCNSPYAQLFSAMLATEIKNFGATAGEQCDQESGPLLRQKNHPLVVSAMSNWGNSITTRTLARLVEIASVSQHPEQAMPTMMGEAFASRGTVSHQVSMDTQARITNYKIDAPTDRYFSDNGFVVRSLIGQKFVGEQWIRQLIWAIDPCVEFSIHLNTTHGEH